MRSRQTYLALFLAVLCSMAGAAQRVPEWWNFDKDPDSWVLARESGELRQGERVYVLKGENPYFWNEMIISGYAKTGGMPDNYIVGFVNELVDNCRPIKVSPIEETPTSVIFEWLGDCRIVGPQVEIRRVAVGPEGVHYLAYAAKPNRLTPDKRQFWLDIIRRATLRQY